jgi:DNA topoisomerase-1
MSLRYVTDQTPGIRRRRTGRGFSYLEADGRPLRDAEAIARIRSLAIPPAWTDVWISPHPHGHLQATGRDARGRKQYRYHAEWRLIRDETKYARLTSFAKALPQIRAQVNQDLSLPGLPRDKVLATVIRLLETTLIRVGNREYARDNEGATPLHLAAKLKRKELIELLTSRGAARDAKDNAGKTPADWAPDEPTREALRGQG